MSYQLFFAVCISLSVITSSQNEYSRERNLKPDKNLGDDSEASPYRMGKLNQIWGKAQKVLSSGKLQTLKQDLLNQDKQEMTWKRLKLDGGDKSGLKEAQLRSQLLVILDRYGLTRYRPDDGVAPAPMMSSSDVIMFKDKRLNRLWEKAEKTGMNQEELKLLREEFQHHEERVQEYHQLVEEDRLVRETEEEFSNEIFTERELAAVDLKRNKSRTDYRSRINALESQLSDSYSQLQTAAAAGSFSAGGSTAGFTDPSVEALWRMAQRANFNADELLSLHAELEHYQTRLQKLQFHQKNMRNADERHAPGDLPPKTEGRRVYDSKIRDKEREVEKLQATLEERILRRHSEL